MGVGLGQLTRWRVSGLVSSLGVGCRIWLAHQMSGVRFGQLTTCRVSGLVIHSLFRRVRSREQIGRAIVRPLGLCQASLSILSHISFFLLCPCLISCLLFSCASAGEHLLMCSTIYSEHAGCRPFPGLVGLWTVAFKSDAVCVINCCFIFDLLSCTLFNLYIFQIVLFERM